MCQAICMVSILASHDRIFYLLAPMLYWLLSSSEVIFTVQGSNKPCTTQSLTHTSGCPVRRFVHHTYVLPWVATPPVLPGRRSLSKARVDLRCRKLGQRPPHILYRFLSFKISRYLRTAWCSLSLIMWSVIGRVFVS